MTDSFPDLSSKLGAPTKKSLFELEKGRAEAKKAREREETAAVYEDFVKSFGDEDAPDASTFTRARRQHGGATSNTSAFSVAPGKRHFTSTGLKSGPGSLGQNSDVLKSGPGSLGPASSAHGRKRPYESFQGQRRDRDRDRDRNHGLFNYDDDQLTGSERRSNDRGAGFQDDEDKADFHESKAAAKPTLHLSSLPPGTSPAVIRALFTPSPLVIEDVRLLPPPSPSAAERKSSSAIVTLAPETPATDIDTMVSHLQNKYLGFGFKLSISRHLSSTALAGVTAIAAPSGSLNNLPFGARAVHQHISLSRAPPPGHGPGRFAPPASYTSSTPYGSRGALPPAQVTVNSPTDLKQLKMIHKTLEGLLTYGPEFEALLMSRPQIQREEKWAWLWDTRSAGGVYYRWRLWDVLTNGAARRRRQRSSYTLSGSGETLFEGQSSWISPEQGLKFEYTTRMNEFISDDDYDSSDEEADNDGGIARRYNDHNMTGAPPAEGIADANEGDGYLNPLSKTKLVHLLSRLPEINAKLRKGDVARITSFAIEHAGAGADEVAELVTRNVLEPMCFSNIKDRGKSDSDDPDTDVRETDEERITGGKKDHSAASLVGLYIISDILSSSASAGVRHAWRYRAIFENLLRQRKAFEILGRLDQTLGWGKLKAEKWKRSVQSLLSLWEGWCVFPQSSHEEFVNKFNNPPLTAKERRKVELEEKQRAEEGDSKKFKSSNKWRSVEDEQQAAFDKETSRANDVDMTDVDGVAMSDDNDEDATNGDAMDETEDVDGVPMTDSSDDEAGPDGVQEEARSSDDAPPAASEVASTPAPAPARKPRMRAVDMFAADDSDGE